jgi:hypothetical protein
MLIKWIDDDDDCSQHPLATKKTSCMPTVYHTVMNYKPKYVNFISHHTFPITV